MFKCVFQFGVYARKRGWVGEVLRGGGVPWSQGANNAKECEIEFWVYRRQYAPILTLSKAACPSLLASALTLLLRPSGLLVASNS